MTAIHFLFPDRALGYQCSTCDQRCCAGSLTFHAEHDRRILDEHPGLRPFVRAGAASQLRVLEMPKPRCYFVKSNGHCELQHRDGYLAKPSMCRLFPVNLAWRIPERDVVFIGVYLAICPLQLMTPGSPRTPIVHDDLRQQIASVLATGELVPAPAARHLAAYPGWFLDVEERLLASFEHDRHQPFEDLLARQLAVARGASPVDHRPGDDELAESRAAISAHLHDVAALLGLGEVPEIDDTTSAALVAMSGLLRMNWFTDATDQDYQEISTRIPFALATVGMLAGLQAQAHAAIGTAPLGLTIQSINDIFRNLGSLAMLMTYLDDAVVPLNDRGTVLAPLRERFDAASLSPDDRLLAWRELAARRKTLRFVALD